MTEHAAVVFVFFFLAEYASIVLICILTTILFLGGYLYYNIAYIVYNVIEYINIYYYSEYSAKDIWFSNPLIEGLLYGISLGLKSSIMIFVFIWIRASFPRIRFDQLMSFCWTILLPLIIAFVVLVPCIQYSFEIIPSNIYLL